MLAGLVTKMDAQSVHNVIPEEDYLDAEESTLEGQKESKFWMNFGAFDANTTSSNYYVGKPTPEKPTVDPEWHTQCVELPSDSVEVPPLEIAFRNFMDDKVPSDRPMPPLKSPDVAKRAW